jgi:hypothetical protein
VGISEFVLQQALEPSTKTYFEFPIGFDEALEYKKAHGQYLRRNQWQDLTVHVYI